MDGRGEWSGEPGLPRRDTVPTLSGNNILKPICYHVAYVSWRTVTCDWENTEAVHSRRIL